MERVIVLGAGMVGAAIAADLSADFRVTSADRDESRLAALASRYPLETRVVDLAAPGAVAGLCRHADLVIGAVPGYLGQETLRTVIEMGRPVVDISFFGQDPFELDDLAQRLGVIAVVDCGVAPGLSNMILGYHASRDTVTSFRCLVGGLPVKRVLPWQYKAPFSPIDVLEEYTRPARLVENGRIVTRPALSDAELVDFEPVGTLEAFNTDGLRSLLVTMPQVPNMVEKTLRYPGHIEHVRVLQDAGFFSADPIRIRGVEVRPIDLTAALLIPQWRLESAEPEFTLMEAVVRTKDRTVTYRLYDTTDEETGFSSMARTTGYTATAAARLILRGQFTRKGICPPEYVSAAPGCFDSVLSDLAARQVRVERVES